MNQSLVIYNIAQLVTLDLTAITPENPLGVIENGAIVIEGGKISWIGTTEELSRYQYPMAQGVDATGKIVLPGLIDSHTHTIFAGNRADEFEKRLQGVSYLEIAQRGGGIRKTVDATRQASASELYELTQTRLKRMLAFGVTTVEVKSGYGLDFQSELKCLEVLQEVVEETPVQVIPTFMGAHDVPPEYQGRTDEYVDVVCQEQIPAVAEKKLAVFCDVFCEQGYFSVAQSRRILETARKYGLKLKIHAEEFCDLGGAKLAGELQAVSADHLLHISEEGIQALKTGGTVATLLPGTAFFLRLKDYAPARKILEAGVPVALATDFNPGSCMSENLQLMMTLGCLQMGMTPVEAIQAVTINAAKALDLQQDRGSISLGKRGDLVLLNVPQYQELLYHYGVNFVEQVYVSGKRVIG